MMGLDQIEAYLTGPTLVAALAAMGLVIGILTGLFGIGGGFLVVPLLNLLFGIDYSLAVGSSLSFTSEAGTHVTIRGQMSRHELERNLTVELRILC